MSVEDRTGEGALVALIVDRDAERRTRLAEAVRQAGLEVHDLPAIAQAHPLPAGTDVIVAARDLLVAGDVATLREGDRHRRIVMLVSRTPGVDECRSYGREGIHDVIVAERADDVALAASRIRAAAEGHRRRRTPARVAQGIIGVSEGIESLRISIERAASNVSNVLITGETGTGKELVAHAIHHDGPRRTGPYVAVNCSAIPEGLQESIFFGHERGAFSGALGAKGLFEQAHGGTLFLDEIGEMSLGLQAKLLRPLETAPGAAQTQREITRVGGATAIPTDVRLIAATNRDLDEMQARGAFRADLLQRIRVIDIRVPALRERGQKDVRDLARYFLERSAADAGRSGLYFDPAALDVLARHDWPGNVRQLQSTVRAIVAMKHDGGAVVLGDLPLHLFEELPGPAHVPEGGDETLMKLDDVIRRHIRRVLRHAKGNKSEAARILGVTRNKLERYKDNLDIDTMPRGDD